MNKILKIVASYDPDISNFDFNWLRGQGGPGQSLDFFDLNAFLSLDHGVSETFDRIQKSLAGAEKQRIKVDHYTRIYGSLYRKIPLKWNLGKIRYRFFSVLDRPNIPIFGLEKD